jgi:hypothetical protein
MSALFLCTIVCQHKKCQARFTCDSPRAEHTRAAAREQGWSHERRPRKHGGPAYSIDLCHQHQGPVGDDEIWFQAP